MDDLFLWPGIKGLITNPFETLFLPTLCKSNLHIRYFFKKDINNEQCKSWKYVSVPVKENS